MGREQIMYMSLAGVFALMPLPVMADEELVRLPGKGELRTPEQAATDRPVMLKPGSGLFMTFDSDTNGAISAMEIEAGIPVAFKRADRNGDGYLTALEQRAWADSLPTRDDSLANPVRFDPNLDRRVSLEEFDLVINNLARDFREDGAAEILLAKLKAPRNENTPSLASRLLSDTQPNK